MTNEKCDVTRTCWPGQQPADWQASWVAVGPSVPPERRSNGSHNGKVGAQGNTRARRRSESADRRRVSQPAIPTCQRQRLAYGCVNLCTKNAEHRKNS